MSNETKTGWVWRLSKDEIIIELQNHGATVMADAKRDYLRTLLINLIQEKALSERQKIESQQENGESSSVSDTVNTHEQEVSQTDYNSDTDSTMSENGAKVRFCLSR